VVPKPKEEDKEESESSAERKRRLNSYQYVRLFNQLRPNGDEEKDDKRNLDFIMMKE
jgi:hypothetical protein